MKLDVDWDSKRVAGILVGLGGVATLVGLDVKAGSWCTAFAFILFFALIDEIGPSRSSVITYINPAVAVLLGVIFLGEPITTGLIAGFPLVLLGSYLAIRKPAPS